MNKFGRSLPTSSLQKGVKILQTPNQIVLTKDGDYNFKDHRLCNVELPQAENDGVNKKYVDNATTILLNKFDLLRNDFTKTSEALSKTLGANKEAFDLLHNDVIKTKKDFNQKFQANNKIINRNISSIVKVVSDNKQQLDESLRKLEHDIKELINGNTARLNAIDAEIIKKAKELQQLDLDLKNHVSASIQNSLKPLNDELVKIKWLIGTEIKRIDDRVSESHQVFEDLALIDASLASIREEIASLKTSLSAEINQAKSGLDSLDKLMTQAKDARAQDKKDFYKDLRKLGEKVNFHA